MTITLLASACETSATTAQRGAVSHPSPTVVPTTNPPTTAQLSPTTQPLVPTTEALLPQTSPDVAARSLLDAWRRADRLAALHLATTTAVDTLFSRPAQSYEDRGCQDPIAGRASCSFGAGNTLLDLGTVSLAGGWVVDQVMFED